MNDFSEFVMERIRHASAEVFTTMLGAELSGGEGNVETGDSDAHDGVVALIGLAGAWAGTGSLSCSPALACRLSSLMLMTDFPAVNEEVLDAIAELTNMIVGGVKNELEPHLGPLGLSIPTVVFGKNFQTRSAGGTKWTVVRFRFEGERLMVRLFLERAGKSGHPHPHSEPVPCALEV